MTMAVVALSIDMILPALGDIRTSFGLASDSNEVAAIITFVFLGLGIGQIFWGPLSDSLGRKRVLAIGLVIYIVAAIGSAYAPSLQWLFVARLIGGFGGAGPLVVARSIVRDVYEGADMARAMSFIMAVFLLVPVVAPTLGTLVLLVGEWQWVFLFMAAFGIGVLAWSVRLPETLPTEARIPLRFGRMLIAFRFVVTNQMAMGYTLALTAVFGFFASYLASSQLILDDIFGLEAWFPVFFGATAVMMAIVMLSNTRIVRRYELRPLLRLAFTGYLLASLAMATAMLITDGHPPFALFVVTLLPMIMFQAFLVPNLNAIAMIPMGAVAGSAAAVIGTISTLGGAIIGASIDRLYDGSLVPFGIAAAVIGVVAYVLMLWADRSYKNAYELPATPRTPLITGI